MSNTMQDMFDLNTAIDQLKHELSKNYNFEVSTGELKAHVHVFVQTESYPEVVQDAFMEFSRKMKLELQSMIDSLVEKRDNMTLQILSHSSKEAEREENGKNNPS